MTYKGSRNPAVSILKAFYRPSSILLQTIFISSLSNQRITLIFIMLFTKVGVLAALLPSALACLGYEGGVPKATTTYSNKQYIEVKKGQVYDGKWARFDRGSGACGGGEGGK